MSRPDHDKVPIYNSRIIDTYIRLVKARYPQVDLEELLAPTGMKPYQIADQGHWFCQEQIDLFQSQLVKLTGNPNIAREAGRYAASPDALGAMRQYALSLFGPTNTFRLLKKATANFTRSSEYDSRKLGPNKVEITVTPYAGFSEKPFQCENRMGFFEAIVLMFQEKAPEIVHQECIFRGGKCCRYIVTWEKTASALWYRVRNVLVLPLLLLFLGTLTVEPHLALKTLLPCFLLLIAGVNLLAQKLSNRDLKKYLHAMNDSTEKLVDQININYSKALLANEIGEAISGKTDISSILSGVLKTMQDRLDFDRGIILLSDPEEKRLELRGGYGFSESQQAFLGKFSFHLNRPESKGPFVLSFKDQKPFLVNDISEIAGTLSKRSLVLVKKLNVHSFICCPIVCDGKALGVMAVENCQPKRTLVQSDMSQLMGIAPTIGVAIRNAELLAIKELQFKSTLQVMAASIDARDPLTAGHSSKVTEYSLGICDELKLSPEYREMVRVAALLHDYGKIGIADDILKKPGLLSKQEFEVVKTHCDKTREILGEIHFEGIYRQVPDVAWSHHERFDGSGYPRGLEGKSIPLGARIIAVADFFEAITSKRHYREPMPLEVAFDLLRRESGRHFDPKVVLAFFSYFDTARNEKDFPGPHSSTRVDIDTEVNLEFSHARFIARSANLSIHGIFVVSGEQIQEGLPVELSFSLPHLPAQLVHARGRIAWINHPYHPKKPTLPGGFGVEFTEISPVARGTLIDYLVGRTAPPSVADAS